MLRSYRMVLLYAVPLALFVGTVTTSRAALSQDIPLGYRIVRRHYCHLRFGVSLLSYHLPRPNERQRAARAGGIRASSAFRGSRRPRWPVRRTQRRSDRNSRSRYQSHGRASHDSSSRTGCDWENELGCEGQGALGGAHNQTCRNSQTADCFRSLLSMAM
jgi:hypothetical protein